MEMLNTPAQNKKHEKKRICCQRIQSRNTLKELIISSSHFDPYPLGAQDIAAVRQNE